MPGLPLPSCRARALVALAFALCAGGCSRQTSETEILPWLKRSDTTTSFGSFGGNRTTVYSKRVLHLFWHDLDAFAITVLDDETVLVRNSQGEALLRRGQFTPAPACPAPPMANVQLPPQTGRPAFDCVSLEGHAANGRSTSVRFRRLHPAGDASIDVLVAASGADRVLARPGVVFYDRRGQAYFVGIAARASGDYRAADPACTLLAVQGDRVRELRPPLPIATAGDCLDKAAWASAVPGELLTLNEVEREIARGPTAMRRR